MFGTATLACSTLVLLSAVRAFWLAAVLLFFTGLFGLVLVASCNTDMQLSAPDELRGRVMSLYTLVWGGVFPIGAFLVGAVSEKWGVGTSLLLNGSAGLLGVVFLFSWWTSQTTAVQAHAPSSESSRPMATSCDPPQARCGPSSAPNPAQHTWPWEVHWHAHMTMANSEKAFGGHLEPGTDVFTFAIVTIGVLGDGVDLSRARR